MSSHIPRQPPILADTNLGRIIARAIEGEIGGGRESTREQIAHEILRSLHVAGYVILNKANPSAADEFERRQHVRNRLINPNVVPFSRGNDQADRLDEVVSMLSQALLAATEGKITFAALVTHEADGNVMPGWAGAFNPIKSIAAVQTLRMLFEAWAMQQLQAHGVEGCA